MKVTASIGSLLLALALPLAAQADDAFEAKLSLSGAAQGGLMAAPLIEKFKVSGEALLNVARGRSPEDPVPEDEVLALVVDCAAETIRLSVLDVDGPTELVTLASSSELDAAFDSKQGLIVAALDVNSVGDADNSLDGGYLVAAGKFKLGAGDCPVSLSTSVTGVIDATITDEDGTDSVTVLVSKGKLSSGKELIATLP